MDADRGLVMLTGDDLSGQSSSTRDMRRMPARRKRQIDPLELKAGDYVVHEQHGVGRFVEMKQREVHGATREYLVLDYGASKRGGQPDRLYVPADSLDQVTRYVGGEQPTLDRLGGSDWSKRKNRARKAVRQIAAERLGSRCQVWIARRGGTPVSGIVVFSHGAAATYWKGATDKALVGSSGATDLLHCRAMQDACQEGRTRYDLGTSGLLAVKWLILLYLIQTCGELCLSPIGLSLAAAGCSGARAKVKRATALAGKSKGQAAPDHYEISRG